MPHVYASTSAAAVRTTRAASAVGTVTVLLWSSFATALPGVLAFGSDLDARLTSTSVSPVEAPGASPADPSRLPASSLQESRIRLGGVVTWHLGHAWLQAVAVALQADIFAGNRSSDGIGAALAADELLSADNDPFAKAQHQLRRFSLRAEGRFGRIEAGRMVSKWGLGVLAQDGSDESYQFGLKRRGAIVDRVQLALLPAGLFGDGSALAIVPLALIVAADSVVQDDLADRDRGDKASQLIAALLMRYPEIELGAYGVSRTQRDAAGLGLDVWVGDVYALWHRRFGKTRVQLATEWLTVRGTTTWFRTSTSGDSLKVDQVGGLVRARVERRNIGLQFDAGYASGDDRPFDDTVSNFKMAHDLRVGIVLFGEMWRRQSANIVANLGDPRFTGAAPAGVERFASNGSATGARYLSPTIRAKFGRLTMLTGLLLADAPQKLVDPHRTGLAGGAPTGPRGGAASRDLGWELDAAAQWDQPITAGLSLRGRLDVGVAFPGAAFAGADGSDAAAVGAAIGQVALRGRW